MEGKRGGLKSEKGYLFQREKGNGSLYVCGCVGMKIIRGAHSSAPHQR